MGTPYSVGTISSTGERVWWENWSMAVYGDGGVTFTQVRPATGEESLLMELILWNKDLPGDRERLLALIRKE